MTDAPAIIVLTTVPNAEDAETLARKIVAAKLAACVQILPPMKSVYCWADEIKIEAENLLLVKTLAAKYDALEQFIRRHHSYDVPEIVALVPAQISTDYLQYLKDYLT